MLKNKFIFFLFLVVIFFATNLAFIEALTFQYPVKRGLITSLFGESRGDHFHSGIDFARSDFVYPIADGEVLFYSDKLKNPLVRNWGTGNYIALSHENDIRSYYYHLKDGSLSEDLTKVTVEDEIGEMGNTGKSIGSHLHLTVFDFKNDRIINPYDSLSQIEDTKGPVIANLLFRINGRTYKIKNNSKLFYYGPLEIIIIAGDYKIEREKFIGNNVVGLKSLSLYIDDKLFKKYNFNFLKQSDMDLVLDQGYRFDDIYGLSHNYKFGTFRAENKEHTFLIIAEDKNGNITESTRKVRFSRN